MKSLKCIGIGLILAALTAETRADYLSGYYIARDNNSTLAGGANFERLTFLFAHGNHFHSIGRVGGAEGKLPEGTRPPMRLFEGTGADAGRFVSRIYDDPLDPSSEYSDLTIRSIHALAAFDSGTPESILYNSSGKRWNTLALDDAIVALELVSISEGLNVTDHLGTTVLSSAGDQLVLGTGDNIDTALKFFTDTGVAPLTNLMARFRLVDLRTSTPFGGSGVFRFEFRTVPEPGSLALLGLGAIGLVGLRRRRQPASV